METPLYGDVEPMIEEPIKEDSVPSLQSENIEKSVIIESLSSDEAVEDIEPKMVNTSPSFVEILKDASIQEGGKFTFQCR